MPFCSKSANSRPFYAAHCWPKSRPWLWYNRRVTAPAPITLAQVGLGYWGPNLLRNFAALPGCTIATVCDRDERALHKIASQYPGVRTTTDYESLLADPQLDAVVIATPSPTHAMFAAAALRAGKHVFVEKPLALNRADAELLVALAAQYDRRLMVGHLLIYHPALVRLAGLLADGTLGTLRYVTAQRLNLGVVRRDENVLWSLAPHDVAVLLHLVGSLPKSVAAHGAAFLQPGVEDVAFLTLHFPGGEIGNIHVSWLDPNKTRRFTVVGSHQMAVFDDMSAGEKLRVYDQGVNVPDYASYGEALTLRFGDVLIPRLDLREPLRLECEHFLEAVRTNTTPRSDGMAGLAVVRVLEAAEYSLKHGGEITPLAAP